jgi:two-component sensor histidine kinase
LRSKGDGWLTLVVADNGIGFPEDQDLTSITGSLGLQLVQMLTSHMGGTVELARDGGTRFTITLKLLAETK